MITHKTFYEIVYLLTGEIIEKPVISFSPCNTCVWGYWSLVYPSSAMLRSEIIERKLEPNDAQRRCAENGE